MKNAMQQGFVIFILALLFGLALNQDRIIRIFYNDSQKHAVPISSNRTNLGDDYHYYVLANDSLHNGVLPKEKVATTNNILLGGLLVSGTINCFFHWLIPSSDIAVLCSLITQTFLLVFAFFLAIKILTQKSKPPSILWMGCFVLIALIFTQAFLFISFTNSTYIPSLLSYYPNILRIVNPQIGWAFGLLYLALLVSFTQNETRKKLLTLSIMSLFFGIFSFSLSLTITISIGIFLLFYFLIEKTIRWSYVLIISLLLLSVSYTYIQLGVFQTSIKGSEIGTGVIQNLIFRPHYLIYLLLIWPLSKLYPNPPRLILTTLLISSVLVGAFCESINLGDRLWVRGAGIYVWILIISMISLWLQRRFDKLYLCTSGIIAGIVAIFFLLPHQFEKKYGFIDTNQWVFLDWINHNLPTGSTILTDDLELSFLFPIYTSAKSFVPMFSYSELTVEDTIKRYFYALDQFGKKQDFMKKIKKYSRQSYIDQVALIAKGEDISNDLYEMYSFYTALIYYPFTKFSENAFANSQNKVAFLQLMEEWGGEKYIPANLPQYMLVKNGDLHHPINKVEVLFTYNKMKLIRTKQTEVITLH